MIVAALLDAFAAARLQGPRRRAAAGAAAAVHDARPRHLRRRDAARRRRRVHHLPRLVRRHGDGQRHQRRQGDGRARAWSPRSASAIASRTSPRRFASCLLRPTVEQGPLGRAEIFEIVRDRLADILEIEPSTISEGQSFVDDLDADSLALIELVEALEEELGERTVGFRIEDEDLADLKTVRDAVDYVHERDSRLTRPR